MDTKLNTPYMWGYDSIINGSNPQNCHFTNFSTPEKTKAWEKGREDAKKIKPEPPKE